ncbi:cytochrome P450 [Cryptosporangium sp. NPDC048952]|uniref:cytochrome P450 n=1 Tax=Cryptosporangium sp. NPDC048952 TaxID=3363961 RepID=UPI003718249D
MLTGNAHVSRTVDEILTDILSPAGRDHLGALYAELHALGEVHRSRLLGRVVTSYRAANAVLRSSDAGRNRPDGRPMFPDIDEHPSRQLIGRTMLLVDPPHHGRLRRLVSKAFTPRAVAGLEPAIAELLTLHLDSFATRAADGEVVDLMTELAFRLPVAVIGRMLGVPAAEQPGFQDAVRALNAVIEPNVHQDVLAVADTAADDLEAYFIDLVRERRARPGDDLTSALIAARDDDDRLSEDELVSTLVQLFTAGFETTTNLIGNGMLALLENPDELAKLRADPSMMDSAVEEMLRYDSPVQLSGRMSSADIPLPDDSTIPVNRFLLVLLGAANQDPRVFTDPQRLILTRREVAPLSFGGGIHYCLGAPLARLEARMVFTELLGRYETIELAGTPERQAFLTIWGLNRLPLRMR